MSATTAATGQSDFDLIRRKELAGFLRARRDATPSPMPRPHRRRAPGLLREEVAAAAGISTTWYVWLEQARPVRVSARTLDGLARALHLDVAERDYLARLARPGRSDPVAAPSGSAGEGLAALVQSLPHPAYVLDRVWNVVAWNAPAAALFGGFGAGRPTNLLVRLFLDPGWRALFVDWADVARSATFQFRAATAELSGDPRREAVVAGLTESSEAFAAWWAQPEVAAPAVWEKRLDHPGIGRLRMAYATYRPEGGDEHARLVIYRPADEGSAAALDGVCGRIIPAG